VSFLEIGGQQIYYETTGRPGDPAVALLHHGLGSSRAFRLQIPALVEAGFFCLAYDRWGYGLSSPRPALDLPEFSIDRHHLEALLDHLGLEQAALAGHSDGGTLALYFAARRPQRAWALVTIAAHIYVEPRMAPGMDAVRRSFEQDERFRQGLQRMHGEQVEQVFYNWYGGWHRPERMEWDMRPVLSDIQCPTLVVQGVEDEHATPQHARDIAAAIPGAELWLVDRGRHMLPQENPQRFNPRLAAFLKRGQEHVYKSADC
jgi:pimeloyl-ACP methyl ester carboxylesterase